MEPLLYMLLPDLLYCRRWPSASFQGWRPPLRAFIAALLVVEMVLAGGVSQAQTDPLITVNAGAKLHSLNPLMSGQNVLFAGNSLWNTRINDIDPAVRPMVKKLAPTLVRFPGGTASNIYLWEDGLGFRTTTEIKSYTPSITLDGIPNWKTVRQARILHSSAGPLGQSFPFMRLDGNRIEGVLGLKSFYPTGVTIRPDGRAGQPDYFVNNYGTMEHMKFVSFLAAEAIIVVNYNTGLDQEGRLSNKVSLSQKVKRAAAWVAFVNGKLQDERALGIDEEGNDWHSVGYWAQKRADLGHPAPYGVKYWEVGNEMYDKNNEGGFTKAQTYAQDFLSFATAMTTVDAGIKLGAVGITLPRGQGDADFQDKWNPTVLRIAGGSMDFLVLHPYYPSAGPKPAPYDSQAWFTAVMAGATQVMADLKESRQVIQENSPPGKQIWIAVTEYGIWPAAAKDPRDWSNLARALFDADLLMGLLRDGPELRVNLATNWILHGSMHSAAIHFNWSSGTRTLRPQYYAMELLRNLDPVLVDTHVASPTFPVQRVGNVMEAAAVPLMGALASMSKDGRNLTLLVINRALAAPMPTTIRLVDFSPQSTAKIWKIAAERISDSNEDIAQTVTMTTGQLHDAALQFTYTFEPHSLTLFRFHTASGN